MSWTNMQGQSIFGVSYPAAGEPPAVYVVAQSDHAWRLFQREEMRTVLAATEAMTKRTEGAVVVTLFSGGKYSVQQVNNRDDLEKRRHAKCVNDINVTVAREDGDETTVRPADPPPPRKPGDFVEDFDAWIRDEVRGKDVSDAYSGAKRRIPVRLTKDEELALLSIWGWPWGALTTVSCIGDKWDHCRATTRLEKKNLVTPQGAVSRNTRYPTAAGWERLRILHEETARATAQTSTT